jgi:phosphonate transport system substrate-binding protein
MSGLDVQASTVPCEGRAVEHLGSGQADVAPLRASAYVHGRDSYGIDAELVNGRFGSFAYRGQINVQASAGYTDVWGLQNTDFAAPDAGSTSGYLAPYLLISQTTGMTLSQFFNDVSFSGDHNQVVRDVYNGVADCGASYEDARFAVLGELPDVLSVVSVLTYTEFIPNEPWAFRPGLDTEGVQALVDSIIFVADTPAGDTALDTIFEYDLDGITVTQDSTYDFVRDLVDAFGFDLTVCPPAAYLPLVVRNY